jgi:hypothetical protein
MSLANAGHTRQNDYGRVGQNLSSALSSPLGFPIQGNNKTKKGQPSSGGGAMMGQRLFACFTGLSTVAPSECEHVAAVAADTAGEAQRPRQAKLATR